MDNKKIQIFVALKHMGNVTKKVKETIVDNNGKKQKVKTLEKVDAFFNDAVIDNADQLKDTLKNKLI